MGYYVTITVDDVRIPKANVKKCLAAINALHTDAALKKLYPNYSPSKGTKIQDHCVYQWVSNPTNGRGFPLLETALFAWRYATYKHISGDIVLESFRGEKWGDDEVLYDAIAPFVKAGGMIECCGEDRDRWAYEFSSGNAVRLTGRLVYFKEGEEPKEGVGRGR